MLTTRITWLSFAGSFRRLADLFRKIRKHRKNLSVLIAFFFYIDGVYDYRYGDGLRQCVRTGYPGPVGRSVGDADRRFPKRVGIRGAGP